MSLEKSGVAVQALCAAYVIWMGYMNPSSHQRTADFIVAALLIGSLVVFYRRLFRVEIKKIPSSETPSPGITTSDLLTSQHREIAKARLERLADDAMMLVNLAPTKNSESETACSLWNKFVTKWRSDVIDTLQNPFGNDAVAYFAAADGFNKHEPVGDVADESADSYRELLHCQRTLKNWRSLRETWRFVMPDETPRHKNDYHANGCRLDVDHNGPCVAEEKPAQPRQKAMEAAQEIFHECLLGDDEFEVSRCAAIIEKLLPVRTRGRLVVR